MASGERLLLDTCAVIALLRGNPEVLHRTEKAVWLGISVITRLEFFAFGSPSESDRALFSEFLGMVEVVGLSAQDTELLGAVIEMRRKHNVKLPDAIILASAQTRRATLLSTDRQLLKVSGVASFH